jgi:mono/diheme cytochrome c family protein
MPLMTSRVCIALAVLQLGAVATRLAPPVRADEGEELFVRRIAPLLQEKCIACHGGTADEIEGGLDLSSAAAVRRGGDSGQGAVAPGSADTSPLYLAIRGDSELWSPMPPKESERLSDEQIGWIQQWIAAGAAWPDAARAHAIADAAAERWSVEDGVQVLTSGGQSPQWTLRRYRPESLWAYQAVAKPEISETHGAAIDRLIADRMPAGLLAAPPADRRTLIRRAAFDLTGLPPAPDDVAAFLSDPLPDDAAFARVVDALLESPHYGERMAQHWLDVVRYADSSGFANDYERGNAWRYRDYVVRAFNDDLPYDEFIRQQIAGDEIDPENPEMIVVAGPVRVGRVFSLTG